VNKAADGKDDRGADPCAQAVSGFVMPCGANCAHPGVAEGFDNSLLNQPSSFKWPSLHPSSRRPVENPSCPHLEVWRRFSTSLRRRMLRKPALKKRASVRRSAQPRPGRSPRRRGRPQVSADSRSAVGAWRGTSGGLIATDTARLDVDRCVPLPEVRRAGVAEEGFRLRGGPRCCTPRAGSLPPGQARGRRRRRAGRRSGAAGGA